MGSRNGGVLQPKALIPAAALSDRVAGLRPSSCTTCGWAGCHGGPRHEWNRLAWVTLALQRLHVLGSHQLCLTGGGEARPHPHGRRETELGQSPQRPGEARSSRIPGNPGASPTVPSTPQGLSDQRGVVTHSGISPGHNGLPGFPERSWQQDHVLRLSLGLPWQTAVGRRPPGL